MIYIKDMGYVLKRHGWKWIIWVYPNYQPIGILVTLIWTWQTQVGWCMVQDGHYTFSYASDYSYCRWQSTPATGLGIAGCFIILAAQTISNIGGGCACCCVKQTLPPSSRTTAILCLIISWYVRCIVNPFSKSMNGNLH